MGTRIRKLKAKLRSLPKPLRLAIAILLTLLGVAGLALPILPGWIFLIPGLVLLSRETGVGRSLIVKLRCWYRRQSQRYHTKHPRRDHHPHPPDHQP